MDNIQSFFFAYLADRCSGWRCLTHSLFYSFKFIHVILFWMILFIFCDFCCCCTSGFLYPRIFFALQQEHCMCLHSHRYLCISILFCPCFFFVLSISTSIGPFICLRCFIVFGYLAYSIDIFTRLIRQLHNAHQYFFIYTHAHVSTIYRQSKQSVANIS